jgi:Tfp pilus assembly protein PilV
MTMRIFNAKPRPSDTRRRPTLRSQAGDTLIEVIVSSLLIGIIVIATLTGLDSSNRSTSLDRARSQADALAQQAEEQLRSEPVTKLSELDRVHEVTLNGTKYTITTTATYYSDVTATASCNSTSATAEDIKTTSTVTWPSIGVSKPVQESSLISPPAGTALIVQVTNPVEPLANAVVSVSGPTTTSVETSADGCAILALEPGSYKINVHKAGYVDQNGFENTSEDLADIRSDYLIAETTTKAQYTLAPASKLEVSFSGSVPAEGDTFVAFNTGQSGLRTFGTLGTYKTVVTSGTPNNIFPFPTTSKYTVYAGTCEANLPTKYGQASNPEVAVLPATSTAITVPLPPVNVKVMSGTSEASPGTAVASAEVKVKDEGCNTTRMLTTSALGALTHPGLPYGEYKFCAGNAQTTGRHWEGTLLNNSPTGPTSTTWTNGGQHSGSDVIYLGTSPTGTPAGTSAGLCP